MDVEEVKKYDHISTGKLLEYYGRLSPSPSYQQLWDEAKNPNVIFRLRKQLLELWVRDEEPASQID